MNLKRKVITNWKTSSLGFGGLALALADLCHHLYIHTEPDWLMLFSAVFSSLVGLFARDADKTSEQCGITPTETSVDEAKEVGKQP